MAFGIVLNKRGIQINIFDISQGLTNSTTCQAVHSSLKIAWNYNIPYIFYTFFWASEIKKSLAQPRFGLVLGSWALDLSGPVSAQKYEIETLLMNCNMFLWRKKNNSTALVEKKSAYCLSGGMRCFMWEFMPCPLYIWQTSSKSDISLKKLWTSG